MIHSTSEGAADWLYEVPFALYHGVMAQAQVSERLIQRIRWLGTPDPTWTQEDGRPRSPWAVAQALAFLERITKAGLPYDTEPQITATARGGIEFFWTTVTGNEIDVTLPAESIDPIEVACLHRQADGTIAEDECEAASVNDAVALVMRSDT